VREADRARRRRMVQRPEGFPTLVVVIMVMMILLVDEFGMYLDED
jgi:hypothetical protein